MGKFGVFAIFKDEEGHTTIKVGDVSKINMNKGIMKLTMEKENEEYEVLEDDINVLIPTYNGVGYPVIEKQVIPTGSNNILDKE